MIDDPPFRLYEGHSAVAEEDRQPTTGLLDSRWTDVAFARLRERRHDSGFKHRSDSERRRGR